MSNDIPEPTDTREYPCGYCGGMLNFHTLQKGISFHAGCSAVITDMPIMERIAELRQHLDEANKKISELSQQIIQQDWSNLSKAFKEALHANASATVLRASNPELTKEEYDLLRKSEGVERILREAFAEIIRRRINGDSLPEHTHEDAGADTPRQEEG